MIIELRSWFVVLRVRVTWSRVKGHADEFAMTVIYLRRPKLCTLIAQLGSVYNFERVQQSLLCGRERGAGWWCCSAERSRVVASAHLRVTSHLNSGLRRLSYVRVAHRPVHRPAYPCALCSYIYIYTNLRVQVFIWLQYSIRLLNMLCTQNNYNVFLFLHNVFWL
jgi:hypothetical protein